MHQYEKRSSSPNLSPQVYQKKIAAQQASTSEEERVETGPQIDREGMLQLRSMMARKLMQMQATLQQTDGEAASTPVVAIEKQQEESEVQLKCNDCTAGDRTRVPESQLQEDSSSSSVQEVQLAADGKKSSASKIQQVAATGFSGSSTSLPHQNQIQESFGVDLSGVQAYIGGEAAAACQQIGAAAYASGNQIAFKEQPSLELAAHEAAHIVQQASGKVQLAGGVGKVGDEYENHADAVAAKVVAGESAKPLLGDFLEQKTDSGERQSQGKSPTDRYSTPSELYQKSDLLAGRQASTPAKANNRNDIKTDYQSWLNFQNSIKRFNFELYDFWEQVQTQDSTKAVVADINQRAEATYRPLLNYYSTARKSPATRNLEMVGKQTIIYGLIVKRFPQAQRIINGETEKRRSQDRQSLLDFGRDTDSRSSQLNNFYLGRDDENNAYGGIKDLTQRKQVDRKAEEIYTRVVQYDSYWQDLAARTGKNVELFKACQNAAMLLYYRESQEIIGGSAQQRSQLNGSFNRLPQQSSPKAPDTASQELINSRARRIFQAITGKEPQNNKKDSELLESLRNAFLIQSTVPSKDPRGQASQQNRDRLSDGRFGLTLVFPLSDNSRRSAIFMVRDGTDVDEATANRILAAIERPSGQLWVENRQVRQLGSGRYSVSVTINTKLLAGETTPATSPPSNAPRSNATRPSVVPVRPVIPADRQQSLPALTPVEQFQQRLKQKALDQLGENRGLIEAAQAKYQNSDAGALGRLRQVVEADERLKEAQDLLTIRQRTNPESWRDKNGTPVLKNQSERQALIDQNQANLNEIQQVRSTLLALYPASGLLGDGDVKETNSDAKLLAILNDRFENILFNISAAIERVNSGDIPLLQLEPLIQATLQQTPEAEKAAVNQYLDSARSQKNTFLLIGFLAQIGLTVAAIFTGGFVGVVMGAIAAATGIGQAAYEFEEADDLNTIAKTGEAGGNQLLADPEAARINYIMGWVNLVLAGIDLGSLAVEGAGALSSGFRGAERIVNLPGGEVLARVTPEQIRNLERSRQLEQAGNTEAASAIVAQLEQELGEATYNELQQVWDEAATVAQKIPVATTIRQLRQQLPDRIGLVESSQLPSGEVRVSYTKEVKIEYAPNASLDDIQVHVPAALDLLEIKDNENLARKLLNKLNELLGRPGANAYPKAFEAQKEIEKHINIIYQNAREVASLPPNSAEAQELLSQIANYQEEIARWQNVLVSEVDGGLGVGYVAARQSTKPEGYWISIGKGGKISTVNKDAKGAFYVTSEQYDAIKKLPSNPTRTREDIFQNLPPELREQASPTKTRRTIVEKPTRVRSDYLQEYENVVLGERIGSGGNKDVYAIQGRNDLAIGILRRGEIEELNTEIEVLQRIESQGLQTIEVLGTTTHNGRPAIMMKKYAQGSKGIVRSKGGVPERVDSADIRLLNQNSIDDLEKIHSILQRKKIYIDDLQFLIAEDGRVYITDPIDINTRPTTEDMDRNADMIQLLIDAAKQNISETKN
jgi:hypothetical protein